eukprot:359525-Chlamydomonas_euryale.AAC.2
MANLRSKPEVARNVAMTLINASQAYVRARRTANGLVSVVSGGLRTRVWRCCVPGLGCAGYQGLVVLRTRVWRCCVPGFGDPAAVQ